MKTFLFFAKDDVSDVVLDWFVAPTDGAAIRSAVPIFSRMRPLDDVSFYCAASLESDTGLVIEAFDKPRFVSKDSYKFPETRSTPLSAGSAADKVNAFAEKVADVQSVDRDVLSVE